MTMPNQMPHRVTVPLPHPKPLLKPPVYAALGMAASYYAYPFLSSLSFGGFLFWSTLFFFALIIALLKVLCTFPLGKSLSPSAFLCLKRLSIIVAAAAIGFSLGFAARKTVTSHVETGIMHERITAVSGTLYQDPRTLFSGAGLGVLRLSECYGEDGLRVSSSGNLSVFFPAESVPHIKEFGRGCFIYAEGTFTNTNRGTVFRADSVHLVTQAPPIQQFRTGLRLTLTEKLQNRSAAVNADYALPVWGGFAQAMLLGARDDLTEEFSQAFFNSGCSYILALSGMHLAIISAVLSFLIRRPLGIRGASLAGALFIIFYVFIAGSQASLVRAAIMYLIGTFAIWGFFKKCVLSVLSMAFIIQLMFQSHSGITLSFILSYLALAGMITLGQTFFSLFSGRLPEIIARGLSASLGAFIATAPIVALVFGSLKPVGIIAGLVIAPLASLFLVLSLAALATAFLPVPLWNIFDFSLSLLYRLLEFVVSSAGYVPGITVHSPVPVLFISAFLWLFVLFIKKQDDVYRSSLASFG